MIITMQVPSLVTIYLVLLLVAVTTNIILVISTWPRRRQQELKYFLLLLLMITGYALFAFWVVVMLSPATKLWVAKIGFIFPAGLPVAWLAFALQFSGYGNWLTLRRILLLCVFSVWMYILVLTNEWHGWVWQEYHFVSVGSFLLFKVEFGYWGWLFYVYGIVLTFVGIWLVAQQISLRPGAYRSAGMLILLGVLTPFFFNILYFLKIMPHLDLDITPIGFSLSGLAILGGVWRFQLFYLMPMARDRLIENMHEGVLVLDWQHRIIDVNPAAEVMVDTRASALIGCLLAEALPDWAPLFAHLSETAVVDFESQQVRNGICYYYEVKVTILPDANGRFAGWLILLHDVSTRQLAQSELRHRVNEMEMIAQVSTLLNSTDKLDEMLPMALTQVCQTLALPFGAIYLWEPDTSDLLLRAKYPEGLPLAGIHHQVGVGITGHVAATGETYVTEDISEDRRAQILPEEAAMMQQIPLRAQMSLPLRVQAQVFGVLHLATIEKRRFSADDIRLATAVAGITANAVRRAGVLAHLEQTVVARTAAIRAEEGKRETILNSVTDAIALLDLDGCINYANQAFATLTGYTMAHLLGRSLLSTLGESLTQADRNVIQTALQGLAVSQGEVTLQQRNGRVYEAAIVITPVRDTLQQLVGYVSSHRDISRHKELERARQRFMTNISHQLRTPLANIKLYTELLNVARTPEKRTQYLHVLTQQADRLDHLVQDILEMTSLDSGEAVLRWEPISVVSVLETAVDRHRPTAAAIPIHITVAPLPVPLPAVWGDENRLTQALSELIDNALDFTPPAGQVTVTPIIQQVNGVNWLTIAVQDTGAGIPMAEQEQIFDRFYRGTLAETGHIPGTGLGLSIAAEIMRAHGGYITVSSKPDEGSTFTLWMPVAGRRV